MLLLKWLGLVIPQCPKLAIGRGNGVQLPTQPKYYKMEFADKDIVEILNRPVRKVGTGCHVIVPKKYLNKTVKIVVLKEGFFE